MVSYGFEGGVSIAWDIGIFIISGSIVNFNNVNKCFIWSIVLWGSNEVYDDSVNMSLNTDYTMYLRGSMSILECSINSGFD